MSPEYEATQYDPDKLRIIESTFSHMPELGLPRAGPRGGACSARESCKFSFSVLVEMESGAGDATAARDAGAVQRQRDRNIKKRDEERAKRLAGEKAKKTRLAEARVRAQLLLSRVLTLTILPLTQSLCWRVRHARKLCSRANSPPTAAGRRPSAASVRVALPHLAWDAMPQMLTIPPCLCSGETQWTDPAEGGCEGQERLGGG